MMCTRANWSFTRGCVPPSAVLGHSFQHSPADLPKQPTQVQELLASGTPSLGRTAPRHWYTLPHNEDTLQAASGGNLAPYPLPENGAKARLLLVGDDELLMHTREILLRREGYATVSQDSQASLAQADLSGFNLALLCRSVLPARALQIAHALHAAAPFTPILRFADFEKELSAEGVCFCAGIATPGYLLAEVQRLTQNRR